MVKSRKFFVAVLLVFSFFGFLCAEEEITTITITNARQTSYKKDDDTGNDTIILEGSVELTVTKGETSSEIKADKITYDRKTEMLFADGNVQITTKGSSAGGETTSANTLLMNTGTLEGIFDGGRVVQTQSDALNLPSGSTLIVFSDIFGKGNNNTIAFKNSSLTFCDEEDPHWHIDASRTWLLPGGEFAFFNAFLFVGVVPVLYLPAFYYPKDELIFNPVFGYKNREGTFIQTTTYLYGRKPLDSSTTSSSSTSNADSTSAESLKALYNFMKPSTLKEQKREGIVLHNLDEDYTGNTSNYLKVMGDWYSNLGAMVGLDGNYTPKTDYISKLSLNSYFGFSNTIFRAADGRYVSYDSTTGIFYQDTANFLGKETNFRYGADFEFALSKPFSLSLSLPIYSDPFFAYDFKEREETMDWISYFLESSTLDDTTETSISEVSTYTWSLSTSYSPSLPSVLKPYLGSVSFSLNSSVNLSSMQTSFNRGYSSFYDYQYYYGTENYDDENTETVEEEKPYYEDYPDDWFKNTPSKKFYYPSQVTPASVTFSLSGTLFQWPMQKYVKDTFTAPSYPISMNRPDEIKSESMLEKERLEAEEKAKAEAEENAEGSENQTEEDEEEEEENQEDEIKLTLPGLEYSPTNNSIATGLTYNLGYSINTNLSTQIAYSSTPLKTAEDFDWNNIRAFMYTLKIPMALTSSMNYAGSFFGVTNKLSFNPIWQSHPIISLEEEKGGFSESAAKSVILADYNAETRNVDNSNSISFKPFYYTEHFSDTGISYNNTINLYRRKFLGDVDNPEWETLTVDWEDEECITVNSVDYILGASEFNNKVKQTLTFTQIMPPQLRQYNGTLNLSFPYVSTSVSTGYKETSKEETVLPEDKWVKNPLQQSFSVSLFDSKLKFSESFNYNLEEERKDSLKLQLGWESLSLAYVMQDVLGATLDPMNGWQDDEEKEFQPYSVSFSFVPTTKTYYKWFNRVTFAPGLNTSLVADLIKPTNSYFIFSPSLSFKINEFFNITFSSTSRNAILYWYFHEGLYDEWGGFPGNIVKDLIDSYRFDNVNLRKGSGFKLKSLNMSMSHELHDWKFNMTFKIEPRLVTENNETYYDFSPYITVGIVWNPMESMKTEIVDEYGEWKLNTNN